MVLGSVEEARAAAERISALSARIREVPGLDGGHVERLYGSLRRLILEYGKRPYWHYRFMLRELDGLAGEVKRLAAEGSLEGEHLALFDLALFRIKKRRFRSAGKALLKLKDGVSLLEERRGLLEDYLLFRRQLEERSKAREGELLRLRGVRAPEAGPLDVEAAERQVAECNAATRAALQMFLARSSAREVLGLCLRMGSEPGLGFLAPPGREEGEALLRLLGQGGSEGVARMGLYDLLEASGFSDARLAHLAPNARRLGPILQANVPWQRNLSRAGEADALSISPGEPPEELRRRIPSLLMFFSEVPGAEEAVRRLRDLRSLVETGRLASIQGSAELYRLHGEDARKSWEGTLADEIAEKERALEELRRDLGRLPQSEAL